ncbi:MAG: zinc ribbon domain-containing protein [Myxococcales bacterium]|nr:zinc ribbon domain-containing protein [Myxococcales bacterium]
MTDTVLSGCDNCGSPYDASAIVCPFCRSPRGLAGLARSPGHLGDDNRLDRIVTENLLARSDAGIEDLLARDLAGPLSPGDLRDALVRVDERNDPSVADLENSLALESAIAVDGITLADLIDKSGSDLKIIKRGLTFLKNRRWAEALEWWTLHRENLSPTQERLSLLLLLMEGFTHRLAGDHRRAADVHARIVAHPLFRRMRGLERK